MHVIVAGPRTFSDYETVAGAIEASPFDAEVIVSGGARGVDRLGERYAREHGLTIRQFLPDYDRHGRRAPLLRNKQMAMRSDALVAVWDGKSTGTAHMIMEANAEGIPVYVHRYDPLDFPPPTPYPTPRGL